MADFLDEFMQDQEPTEGATETEEVVQPEVVTEQPAPEPQPEAEPAPVIEPAPEAPKEDEQRTIPLATALQWRDEAKELKRWKEQQEAQRRQEPAAIDPFDDPVAFAAQQQSMVQQAIIADRFERSNEDAIEKFGKEKVSDAVKWAEQRAQSNPAFAVEYMSKPRPIHWIVQQHQRDAMLSEIGDNPDDYFAREAAKRGYVLPSATVAAPVAAVAQQVAKPTAPPRSIASERTAPAPVTPEGDKDGFLAAFK